MISFVICDSNVEEREYLAACLRSFAVNFALTPCRVQLITGSIDDVWDYMTAPHRQTVYFSEISIEKPQDGIELCHQMHVLDPAGVFLYCSARTDLAMACFASPAFDFIPKPVVQRRLFDCLQALMTALAMSVEQFVPLEIHSGSYVHVVNQRDILYFQSSSEYVTAYMTRGRLTWRESFTKLLPRLRQDWFARCHKSVVI